MPRRSTPSAAARFNRASLTSTLRDMATREASTISTTEMLRALEPELIQLFKSGHTANDVTASYCEREAGAGRPLTGKEQALVARVFSDLQDRYLGGTLRSRRPRSMKPKVAGTKTASANGSTAVSTAADSSAAPIATPSQPLRPVQMPAVQSQPAMSTELPKLELLRGIVTQSPEPSE